MRRRWPRRSWPTPAPRRDAPAPLPRPAAPYRVRNAMSTVDDHRPGHRRLRRCWQEGRPGFGLWGSIPTGLTAELAAAAGYDYVCVDLQHGGTDQAAMLAMFTALE